MFICHFGDGDGGLLRQGDLSAWFFRWPPPAKPGLYAVTLMWSGFIRSFDAVVDDYGSLVLVPEFISNPKESHHV